MLQTNKQFRLNVLVYEIGDLVKSVVYSEVYGKNSPEMRRAFRYGEEKKALADALIQLLIFIDIEGFSYDEILKIGLDGLKEFLERKK